MNYTFFIFLFIGFFKDRIIDFLNLFFDTNIVLENKYFKSFIYYFNIYFLDNILIILLIYFLLNYLLNYLLMDTNFLDFLYATDNSIDTNSATSSG